MSLDSAIQQLELETSQLQMRVSKGKPQAGSTDQWLLQGKSFGLSLLRTMKAKGVIDFQVANAFRQQARKDLQLTELE